MRIRAWFTSVAVLFAAVVVFGCAKKEEPKPVAPPPVSAAADGKALFEQKCSVCHGIDRATARADSKEKWASIIKDMQARKADWISDEEAAKILEYLSAEHGKK